MRAALAALAVAALVAGCAERRHDQFAARCERAGLQPGTEAHARCVIDLERDWAAYWDNAITANATRTIITPR